MKGTHGSGMSDRALFASHEASIWRHGNDEIQFRIDRNSPFNWAFMVGAGTFWGGCGGLLTYVMFLGALGHGTLYVPVWVMWLLAIVTGASTVALVAFAVTRVISQTITLRSIEEEIAVTRVAGGMTRSKQRLLRPTEIVVEYRPWRNDWVVAWVFVGKDAERVLCGRYVVGRGRSGRRRLEKAIDEVSTTLSIARR